MDLIFFIVCFSLARLLNKPNSDNHFNSKVIMKNSLQKITTNLWFDSQAEEAAYYYVSIFKNSRIIKTTYYGKEGFDIHGMKEGTVLTVEFALDGHLFTALNGGPVFKFNESISFIINCENQAEIDYYWEKLKEGGDVQAQQCGWLKDKFGVSWQVVPEVLNELLSDSKSEQANRTMKDMLKMKKLNIDELQKAYDGK